MKVDVLVVGAGLTGLTFAERLAALGRDVLVMDERNHIAGNCYDYYDQHGVLVHAHGPHAFHTNSSSVWRYLSQFTKWRQYSHRVLAHVLGRNISVPLNLEGMRLADIRGEQLDNIMDYVTNINSMPLCEVCRLAEKSTAFFRLAGFAIEHIFKGYSEKQWGMSWQEVKKSGAVDRIPIRFNRDDRYFEDTYQAMPAHGYTKMCQNMIDSRRIRLLLNADYFKLRKSIRAKLTIYTGPIDVFFGLKYGPLSYRSLEFSFEHHNKREYQSVSQINYPNNFDYTRVTEFKHMTGQEIEGTTIAYEYPKAHVHGQTTPYYPVKTEAAKEKFAKYADLASELKRKVVFAGRLGRFQYYNMDQCVASALESAERIAA